MLILLSSLYMIYGFLFLYSYVKDIGLLRYLYAKKNINTLLTIELIFIIVASFIVFMCLMFSLGWVVLYNVLMIFHLPKPCSKPWPKIWSKIWPICSSKINWKVYEKRIKTSKKLPEAPAEKTEIERGLVRVLHCLFDSFVDGF